MLPDLPLDLEFECFIARLSLLVLGGFVAAVAAVGAAEAIEVGALLTFV
jgi:hypothetical protein